ncbi:MAG TPA: MFS transporter [Anaeromyxobacteraceae bacterium]|nr:MFS transporter [Anaeromyxobacteraceae bacterium]
MSSAWRLRLLYFLYYGAVGAFLPYYAPYLRGLGFSGGAIGTVQMLGPLVAPVAALGWAALADRTGAPERTLRLATLLSAAAAAFLPLAATPLAAGAVVLAQALGDRAVVPLLDTLTLEHVRDHPGQSYARIRLGGSIGFALLSLLVGWLLAARGDRPGDLAVPLTVSILVAGYALAARGLPHAEAPRGPRPGWPQVRALLQDRGLLLLLAAGAVHWLACAPFHLLFGLFVRERGLPSAVTGLGMSAGVAAEVAVLLLFPRLERRFSLRALFAAAFAASSVRWLLLAGAEGAAAVIALQLLHGFTFGLFWGSAVAAMSRIVPGPLRATGQAIFSAVVFGGGNGLGYQLAGLGLDRYGAVAPLFRWAGVIELLPLLGALAVLGRPTLGSFSRSGK